MSLFDFEKELLKSNKTKIIGIDEVGRGALAGPMVVCAVLIDTNKLLTNNDILGADLGWINEVKDSKLLTPKKREFLANKIKDLVENFSFSFLNNFEIDNFGISKCTQKGFSESIEKINKPFDHILTDAFEIKKLDRSCQTNIIKGDNKSFCIACASILAKVHRDEFMSKIHLEKTELSVYTFSKHKGYGTKLHYEEIKEYGISSFHRKSFLLRLNT